ncbi:MAG: imidazole glycerol phosphate synthase subunit HisH [Demequinaceae bacterium]|nr:imidazole glycerol phosphate synthase subunit HisH [Demequinaceae bacterium]
MASPLICVLDYGFGNVRSAVRAVEEVGGTAVLTADQATAEGADGLIVPGVGAYAAVMEGLLAVYGDRIIEHRLAGGRAVLGVCVGLQVMFEKGIEHDIETTGLGQWPGTVEKLDAPVVPNMGWARVEAPEESRLFKGIEGERFYFVHSFAAKEFPLAPQATNRIAPPLVTWSEAGTDERPDRFVAAVENGPLSATQFHPEKSGDAGLRLLRNWLATL